MCEKNTAFFFFSEGFEKCAFLFKKFLINCLLGLYILLTSCDDGDKMVISVVLYPRVSRRPDERKIPHKKAPPGREFSAQTTQVSPTEKGLVFFAPAALCFGV